MRHKDYYWVILLIGCILIIIAPSIFTLPWRDKVLGLNTNFKCTGQIGDTIGGITAPIIGLISIWLLYITFREQREFNKKQVEFNEKQLGLDHYISFTTLVNDITEKLCSIEITYNGEIHKGLEKILALNDKLKDIDEQEFLKLKEHLIYAHRLIRMFLQTNKNALLENRIKLSLYKIVKDIASDMIKIYSILEKIIKLQIRPHGVI